MVNARKIKTASKKTVQKRLGSAVSTIGRCGELLTEKGLVVRDGPIEAVREFSDTVDGPGVDEDGGYDDTNQKFLHLPIKRLRGLVMVVVALVKGLIPRAAPGVLDHQEGEEGHRD